MGDPSRRVDEINCRSGLAERGAEERRLVEGVTVTPASLLATCSAASTEPLPVLLGPCGWADGSAGLARSLRSPVPGSKESLSPPARLALSGALERSHGMVDRDWSARTLSCLAGGGAVADSEAPAAPAAAAATRLLLPALPPVAGALRRAETRAAAAAYESLVMPGFAETPAPEPTRGIRSQGVFWRRFAAAGTAGAAAGRSSFLSSLSNMLVRIGGVKRDRAAAGWLSPSLAAMCASNSLSLMSCRRKCEGGRWAFSCWMGVE